MDMMAVTGHRPNKLGGYSNQPAIDKFAVRMVRQYLPDYTALITGMAIGWDQAVAQAAIELEVPFYAYVPFKGQEGRWPRETQRRYFEMLSAAEDIIYTADSYRKTVFTDRNCDMIHNASVLLALFDGSIHSGTGHCVRYAERANVPVINVWKEWKEI